MKGVIFKHFEAFVIEAFGAERLEAIFEQAVLQTPLPFIGPATYPDEDLFSLAGTTIRLAGLEPDAALFAFGRFLYPRLAASVPGLIQRHRDTRSLLDDLDRVIHVEVRKLMPEAITPRIRCRALDDGVLEVTYRSPRKMCALFRGLLDAAAESFGERVIQDELECVHRGAEACRFELRFEEGAARAAA